MYVEDLLVAINDVLHRGPHSFDGLLDGEWHRNFIHNVVAHIDAEHQLSTNQGQTILKLIAKVRHCIVAYGMATDLDVFNMLKQPEYRRPLYESVVMPREVRHLGSNFLGFRFKQNDLVTKRIKKFGEAETIEWSRTNIPRNALIARPHFDWPTHIWVVPVFRHNLSAILRLIKEYRFGVDAATAEYLQLASQSYDKPSIFALYDDFILGIVSDNPLLAGWITEIADGIAL